VQHKSKILPVYCTNVEIEIGKQQKITEWKKKCIFCMDYDRFSMITFHHWGVSSDAPHCNITLSCSKDNLVESYFTTLCFFSLVYPTTNICNKHSFLWCLMPLSVISWRSVLLVEETGENHRPGASHWQTLWHNVVHLTLSRIQTNNISGDRHRLHRYM
jgi:hypothetical protein